MRASFEDGIAAIQEVHDYAELRARLATVIEELRSTHDGETRPLAIRGFEATLRGVEARNDFVENDSGNIEAATRDAKRADAALREGARLLRAAGKRLGVEVGELNGF